MWKAANRLRIQDADEIRRKVLAGIEDMREGRYKVYENAEALQGLLAEIKLSGRKRLLSRSKSKKKNIEGERLVNRARNARRR